MDPKAPYYNEAAPVMYTAPSYQPPPSSVPMYTQQQAVFYEIFVGIYSERFLQLMLYI